MNKPIERHREVERVGAAQRGCLTNSENDSSKMSRSD